MKFVIIYGSVLSMTMEENHYRILLTVVYGRVIGFRKMKPEGHSLIDVSFVIVGIPGHSYCSYPFPYLAPYRLGGWRFGRVVSNYRVCRIQNTLAVSML